VCPVSTGGRGEGGEQQRACTAGCSIHRRIAPTAARSGAARGSPNSPSPGAPRLSCHTMAPMSGPQKIAPKVAGIIAPKVAGACSAAGHAPAGARRTRAPPAGASQGAAAAPARQGWFEEPASGWRRRGAGRQHEVNAQNKLGWVFRAGRPRTGPAPLEPFTLNESAPPTPRTKWTRRVLHPVLIGHAASNPRAATRLTNRFRAQRRAEGTCSRSFGAPAARAASRGAGPARASARTWGVCGVSD